ncbi:recombinase family protein [Clostridium polynesiense]|uniref:recombinase family protein n=1 Tax=Clostridium polynesiense TaxID=1325933 RepID=UPI00058FDFB0|nr:recombinase family protein [Clostridium polynesiense]
MIKREVKNVVLYTRVSTEEQVEGFSLEAQKSDLIKYCSNNNYNIVGEYEDAGISGTTIKERPQFKQMLKEISENKIDAIIAWKLSRISRNMLDLVEILEYLQACDSGLITITDQINTFSTLGKSFFYLAGIFAEMERDNIVEQSKNGMKQRAKNGLTNGGTPPYGYINNKDGKGLIIDNKSAEIIRTIFNLYTNKGYGYSKICRILNSEPEKYPTRMGKGWSYQSIQQVLDNPTYNGYIRWGLYSDWSKKRRKGMSENYVLAKGQHEAIIDDLLWTQTQERRKHQCELYTASRLENIRYLLSGLGKCPECGSSMISHRTQRTRKSDGSKIWYRYYVCSRWANKKGMCRPNLVNADVLEKEVLERIKEFVQNPNLPELLIHRLNDDIDIQKIKDKIININKKISKLNSDEDKYYALMIDDEILKTLKKDKILENISKINTEVEKLKSESGKLSIQIAKLNNTAFDLNKVSKVLKNFDINFDRAPFEHQKALIHSLIGEIKIRASNDISERTTESIILRITDTDLNCISNNNPKAEKAFEATYGTVPPQ